jgi:cell pole-organizing protein PopZ
MAEAKGKKGDDQDQSMEEILQSIRRIIAEEGDDSSVASPPVDEKPIKPKGSEILELTDMVKDDGSVENVATKEIAPMASSPSSADVLMDIDRAISNPPQKDAGEGLLSQESALAAAAALRPVMEVPSRPSAPQPRLDSPAFRNGNTVEDLVMEALRPMLKDWLDTNLKGIVERLVEKEIKRIVALNSD